jgi:hypothetical protein
VTEMELGGNITLVGFKEVSKAELVVVKKIVGSYARKLADSLRGFERLKITLKPVHKTEGSEKFELNAHVIVEGNQCEAEVTERNLFVGLDTVLHKVTEHAVRESEKRMK